MRIQAPATVRSWMWLLVVLVPLFAFAAYRIGSDPLAAVVTEPR